MLQQLCNVAGYNTGNLSTLVVPKLVRIRNDFAGIANSKMGILGTLHYMSPEQLRGEKADSRSDIFRSGSCCTRC